LVRVTEQPGITWFVVSATVPVTELEPVCAMAEATKATVIASVEQIVFSIISSPLLDRRFPHGAYYETSDSEMHRIVSADCVKVNQKTRSLAVSLSI
jgi:hypothetical protein